MLTNDNKTTVLGILGAALLAARLDWAALLKGDAAQLGLAVGVGVTALLGYYTNKTDAKPAKPPSGGGYGG